MSQDVNRVGRVTDPQGLANAMQQPTTADAAVDAEGFARPGWGDRIRRDVNVYDMGSWTVADLQPLVLQAMIESLRIRDKAEGRPDFPPNPPARKVSTIEIHINFKPPATVTT